ncbi:MAG: hypothetical protein DDT38_01636 [Firmicutes bacterium]|nr:hypothetical protein [candidate division NPL-UPA2 bacterium]
MGKKRAKTTLYGHMELQKTFENLMHGAQEECVEVALTDAAEVVRADAEKRAPRRTGALARSIRALGVRKTRHGGTILVAAGVKTGSENAFYAHMVEKGHVIAVAQGRETYTLHRGRVRTRTVTKIKGKVAPRPFLRPALDENEGEIMRVFTEALGRAIRQVKL